mgnify:FL=1|jgi:hypothetical protein|nr:MAG TPA: hypothetical protein [Caudoviricetes sp.]
MENLLYKNVKYIHRVTKRNTLVIINTKGEIERCLSLTNFKGKSRDFFMNEAEGYDVTSTVNKTNLSSYSEATVEKFVEESDHISIAFGHDNFILFRNVLKPHERSI